MSSIQLLRRLGLGLGLAVFATTAPAETVNCTPITSLPYTISAQGLYCLNGDLATTMASGNAITINASNVVVDLNGHKLGGLGAGPATAANGIFANSYQNITIKNGTIRGFQRGIWLGSNGSAQGHVVEDVRADQNTVEGILVYGRGCIVRRNQVVATGNASTGGYAIDVIGPGGRVIDNDVVTVLGAGSGLGIGISFNTSIDSIAVGNRISGAASGIVYGNGATGKYRDNMTTGVAFPYTGGTDAGNNN